VPVVATAVGGLRETIVDGVTGWTYPLGDAGALAAAMAALLDHPDEALRRARAGRAMVMERFERRAVFGKLREAFEVPAAC
jgi:glycosyltransferase involved in cell wall biosynthesis